MRLGLFTPVFQDCSFEAMLAELKKYPEIESLELGTGGWPRANHLNVDALLASKDAVREYRAKLSEAGLTISALSCHGNAVHPVAEIARRDDVVFRKTVLLAEAMGVSTVVTFSGCPGGGAEDRTPNWIVAAWPPEFSDALKWQWEERLIPYWREAGAFAREHSVKVALEAHPGFMVYNTETMLRLRAAVGESVGMNFDPSHLWWQGVDIAAAIESAGNAIFHFHAKDVAINPRARDRNGVLDTKSYTELASRSWNFRSVGWGHGELEWKQIVTALRLVGYDGALSIEHEDALMSRDEGLRSAVDMLARVLMKEKPVEAWWV